ncbi:MAG: hypothetical protein HYZ28_23575 [Myxococcales bacterium]|nr:hypothetical protein [Myxococcales bacterium]
MRFLLIAIGLALAASSAEAGCKRDGILAFPAPGAVVPTNVRFILEGVGAEQARVSNLVGQELILRAQDDSVSVKVLQGWKSTAHRVAVMLKPNQRLQPNRSYTLMADAHLPSYVILNQGAGETFTWRAGDSADEAPPKYLLKPAVVEGIHRGEGDSLTRFLKVTTTLTEESPSYLVVSLRRARGSNLTQTYFLPLDGAEAMMGHDECSGSFTFDDGRAYKATIEAYDATGNMAPRLPQVEFQAPTRVER